MDTTTLSSNGFAAAANDFNLDQECYTDSRQFLQNKPLLRHITSQLEALKRKHSDVEDACTAFVDTLDSTDISCEETLELGLETLTPEPLIALPDIAAIACRECGRVMPTTEAGVVVSELKEIRWGQHLLISCLTFV